MKNNRCNMKYLICLAALLWAGMKLTAADNVKEVYGLNGVRLELEVRKLGF